jgi:esterase
MPTDRIAHANGVRFHYLDHGTPTAPPVLMIHGAAQTAHSFDEVAPNLARDHHVVCMDQRGHGDTDWTPRYRRDDFVADIAGMLDHLRWRRATLVAMSLGGLNAIAFAAQHPARVRALVLVDVVPSVAPEGAQEIGKQLALREFPSFDAAVEMAHAFNPRRSLDNLRQRLSQSLRPLPDGRWTYKFDPAIASGATELDRLWVDVRRLQCPSLLVRGAESPIVTVENAERFTREAARGTLTEVAGAGHSVMGDNPAGFVAAVRPFLRRHGGGSAGSR